MADEVRPVSPVDRRDDRRAAQRRAAERRLASQSRALVTTQVSTEPAESPARPAPKSTTDASDTTFMAQVIGQGGQKRGLKGGPPVRDTARSTYLGTAYSGAAERRPKPGKATDTDV